MFWAPLPGVRRLRGSSWVFERVAIIGLGLIGSSLARVMRERGIVREIAGHSRSEGTRSMARELRICDVVCDLPTDAVRESELVVLCTPVGAFRQIVTEIRPALQPGAILTDVGGVKTSVVRDLAPLIPPQCSFVPGHPIAGTENSGPASGFASLFEQRWCILTPEPDADPQVVARVRALWEAVGSRVAEMTPAHHDQALSIISHLPHALACVMVGVAGDVENVEERELIRYSASGFRDFTRIAASEPEMWRDIFLANREAVLEGLSRFAEEMFALQRAIRWGDSDRLVESFRRGRQIRRQIVEAGQDAEGSALYLTRRGRQVEDDGSGQPPQS